jgi:lysophospholipase L1-like esterase
MFWYEQDVKQVESIIQEKGENAEVVFYGSSSIRLWTSLQESFSEYKTINLGFGGSTLAACVWYFKRLTQQLQPKVFIIYAGDNDLGDGRHPEEVFLFYKQLVAIIRQRFNNIPIIYISIKPSILRFHIIEQIKFTNKIIETDIVENNTNVFFLNVFDAMLDENGYPKKELFEDEGLHINQQGYSLWSNLLRSFIQENNIQF